MVPSIPVMLVPSQVTAVLRSFLLGSITAWQPTGTRGARCVALSMLLPCCFINGMFRVDVNEAPSPSLWCKVSLFSPYWVDNRTGMDLIFKDVDVSKFFADIPLLGENAPPLPVMAMRPGER